VATIVILILRRKFLALALVVGQGKQYIGMTRSGGSAPANEILAFQFPAGGT
jgi:hypothetical protein